VTAEPPRSATAVELQGVTRRFGSVVAVDSVTLSIPRGEFFSLLGPSGCGKTTLLRILGGFEIPDEGQVFIGGEAMGARPPYLRPTNMVFQHLALFPHMSVFQNIAFGLRMKGAAAPEIARRVRDALAFVRLEGLEGRRISQLSGGQQQRVAIARAIVNDPQVLLLDEPFGALDLQLRLQMQLELKRIHQELGGTFIFVTHDQGEAMTMSNRIAVMYAGRVVQLGTPAEIYEHPETAFVAKFIGDTNLLAGRVTAADGARTLLETAGVDVVGPPRPGFASGQPAFASLRYERVRVAPADESSGGGLVNVFEGRIRSRVYIGSAVRYEVAVTDRLSLVAQAPNTGDARLFAPGDRVRVGWNPGDVVLLPGEGDPRAESA
jgi:spermidine/putrescine transport system ATP-binding protein